MNKELYVSFNEQIHRYRNSLIYHAKRCDWEKFKANAGSLFDYCESIEMSEIEKRFVKVFGMILAVLFVGVALFFKIQPDSPELAEIKKIIMLTAVGGSCYELYFYLNFRTYIGYKTALYKKRRERFIMNIEQDFKNRCSYQQ